MGVGVSKKMAVNTSVLLINLFIIPFPFLFNKKAPTQ